jgi:hypothetical protein
MNQHEALDAAVLAFVRNQAADSLDQSVQAAIDAYELALTTCRACAGSGQLRARGGLVHLSEDYRPADRPVPDGDEIGCIACGGHGVDPEEVTWLCKEQRGVCAADRPVEGHEDCGWARPLRQSRSDSAD